MLVKSFLAIPKAHSISDLKDHISKFSNCEVTSPENGDQVLVVVMENSNKKAEEQTLTGIHESPSLEHMVLVSSFNSN